MVLGGVSNRCPWCASAVGELAAGATADVGLMRNEPAAFSAGAVATVCSGERREGGGTGLDSEEIRVRDEAVDDAEAASLGRSRMADGRRVELSVEELVRLVDAEADGPL